MRRFARLLAELDDAAREAEQVAALVRYFAGAAPEDGAWAAYLLLGRKLKRAVAALKLREWGEEASGLPPWLFRECLGAVGDDAEAIALAIPPPERPADRPLHSWIEDRLLPLAALDEAGRRVAVRAAWAELDAPGRFLWNRLLAGGVRAGVARRQVIRALAEASGAAPQAVAHRLAGSWDPSPGFYRSLLSVDAADAESSRPYPPCPAQPLEGDPAEVLGDVEGWRAEWKRDGIRAQVIHRSGSVSIWTGGEELATARYPEIAEAAARWPDGTVVDGEILPGRDGEILPFEALRRRLGRESPGKAILRDAPVILMAFDLLEDAGQDCRGLPLEGRLGRLDSLLGRQHRPDRILASAPIEAASWGDLEALRAGSRAHRAEGLMLKRRGSPYGEGRPGGDWWAWEADPLTFDGVLVAACRGGGRGAGLSASYTFAVWDGDRLVPVAQADSGLDDEEVARADAWIREHGRESFGPVRTVAPELVFEVAFESIRPSARHKSGVAIRSPRILRRRDDIPAAAADTLDSLRALIAPGPAPAPPREPRQRSLFPEGDEG